MAEDVNSLAEFLRARIAEDEAAVVAFRSDETEFWGHPFDSDHPNDPPWKLKVNFSGDDVYHIPLIEADARRVLAECEAKRQIVEQWEMMQPPVSASDDRLAENLFISLMHLALPYESHPDYCEEWRADAL